MKKPILFWIISFLLTFITAYYQRTTGPTYPLTGKFSLGNREITYSMDRSHGGDLDHTVKVNTGDPSVSGILEWKRYKTSDDWTERQMLYNNGTLGASLPHQPPAGKLEYRIVLTRGDESASIPSEGNIIIRFKGDVPLMILIPHVIAMFGGMLLSTRTGLELFNPQRRLKRFILWTLGFLFVGGFILGPLVQYYAFGEFWTGFPFGTDLTDNKTVIAFLGWIAALFAMYRSKKPERWAFAAALLLLIVYLIPHSLMGSELDYSKIPQD